MEKLNGTIEWTIVWKNWMTNLVDKFIVKLFGNKLGVRFIYKFSGKMGRQFGDLIE